MFESLTLWALVLAGTYLVVGVLCAIPLHVRGLPRIDAQARGTSILFRILVTPGMLTLWPLLIHRWAQANRDEETMGALLTPATPEDLRRWHGAASLLILLLCPAIILTAIVSREMTTVVYGAPTEVIESTELLRQLVGFGNVFPSVPATVFLARSADKRYGFLFQFDKEVDIVPTALYWSPSEEVPGDRLPPNAEFIGMIWCQKELWRAFPRNEMKDSGYWIAYSFLDQRLEPFSILQARAAYRS